MDILVTGGVGFIGSHARARLLQERHPVWAVDDLNDFDDPNLKRSALREFQASARPDEANPAPASNSDRSCCVVSCTSSRIDTPARQHSNASPLTESLDEAAPDGAGHPSELPVRAQRFHRDRFRSDDPTFPEEGSEIRELLAYRNSVIRSLITDESRAAHTDQLAPTGFEDSGARARSGPG